MQCHTGCGKVLHSTVYTLFLMCAVLRKVWRRWAVSLLWLRCLSRSETAATSDTTTQTAPPWRNTTDTLQWEMWWLHNYTYIICFVPSDNKVDVLVWCLQISFVSDLSFCILTVFCILCYSWKRTWVMYICYMFVSSANPNCIPSMTCEFLPPWG